jgi:hypothetical protein
MTEIAAAAGVNGSEPRPFDRSKLLRKSRCPQRLFRVLGSVPLAGKTPPACWTSPDRFAKRRPLAKAFPGRFRAHSSVGRAADS